jgi:LuxR family maltose regulon positive regulatory protein
LRFAVGLKELAAPVLLHILTREKEAIEQGRVGCDTMRKGCTNTMVERSKDMAERTGTAGPLAMVEERKILQRSRVDALLDKALARPVTSVIAGPGYGKSIAVYSYLRESERLIIWVQLAESDNMPAHFWETFLQAFAPINPDLSTTLFSLGFPESEEMLYFIAELFGSVVRRRFTYVFVFDDLHLLEDGPVLDFIGWLIHNSSEVSRIILISRYDNIPDVPGLIKKRRLSRVDESELLFTEDEVVEYFRQMGVTPADEILSDIYYDTEGLPFFVSLAARLLEKNPDGQNHIRLVLRGGYEQIINTYLFSVISDELRHFLLKLSLVGHLSPEFIEGIENGRRLMSELVRATALIRYDRYMHVYRLHHLLLGFLEKRQDMLTETERLEAYTKVARWCAVNGYRLDALRYYHKAGDYGSIIALSYTYPLVMPLDVARELFEMFEAASEEVLDSHPAGRILYARLTMTVGRVDEAIEQVRDGIALLEKRPPSADNSRTLMGLHNNLGFAEMLKYPVTDDCGFYRHFEDALKYFEMSGDPPTGGYQMYNVGPYAFRIGRDGTDDPEPYIEAVRRAAACTTITMRGCMHGFDSLTRAEYAFFCGSANEAENHALRCATLAHNYGQFEIESRALFILIRVYLQMGKYEMIMDALAQLEALIEEPSFTYRHLTYDVISSWLFAVLGEVDQVESWLKSDQWSSGQNRLISGMDDFAKARYYLTQKNYQTLLSFIDSRTPRYGVAHFILGRIGALAMRAVCLLRLGEREEAFSCLREGYELARPLGLDMSFVEMGGETRSLINAALKAPAFGVPTEWLEQIRSRATAYAKRIAFVRSRYQAAHSIDTSVQLTEQELEVLADLTRGLSRTEISAARGVSLNTVKSMLQLIFDKLGAENAMDAIRIATTKRLL